MAFAVAIMIYVYTVYYCILYTSVWWDDLPPSIYHGYFDVKGAAERSVQEVMRELSELERKRKALESEAGLWEEKLRLWVVT